MSVAIVWFRQDLRVHDNTALIQAVRAGYEIVPLFIFDTTILARSPARDRRIGFLIDALQSLNGQLLEYGSALTVLYGDPIEIIPQLCHHRSVGALYANRSYGDGATRRDVRIQQVCEGNSVSVSFCSDFLLVDSEHIPARKVFTPFYKLRQQLPKPLPQSCPKPISTPDLPSLPISIRQLDLSTLSPQDIGGEANTYRPIQLSSERLQSFDFARYDDTRNLPSIDGSSKLSPYTRFGLMSIRQLYAHALSTNATTYISELAWREFRHHIAYYFPETLSLEFQEKRRNLTRHNDPSHINAWKHGMTGYPIVDAGMRQLLETNWMHNRVRMIVASFLTKDLMVDRRIGEQHFHDYLIDYDRNVNIGNRQRSASVGADPKPLRIFSPILQAQRFDQNASYILQRCPELVGIDPVKICDPLTFDLHALSGGRYPRPIVDHAIWSKKAKAMYMKQIEPIGLFG